MPQFTGPLVVKDGSAVPADVSYYPEKLSSSDTILVDRREASRDMQPSFQLRFDPATSSRKTYKIQRDITYPLVRVVGGVATVTDIARVRVIYTIPTTATAQERKHLRAAIANLENHTTAKAGVEDLDPLY